MYMGINIRAAYCLQSVMRTKWSNILSLMRGLILSGALIYLLSVQRGIDGVWWAMAVTESAVVLLAVMCLRKADKDGLQGLKN